MDRTAIESAAQQLEVRYDLYKGVPLRGPLGETERTWILVAFAANLDGATVAMTLIIDPESDIAAVGGIVANRQPQRSIRRPP